MKHITDEAWLNANLNPAEGRTELGICIPDLPPDELQLRFTGRCGRANFEHIFDFYKLVLANMPPEKLGSIRLVDFGGGWGRILRLFLREYPADQLVLFDCLTEAIDSAKSLNPPFSVQQNQIMPPLPLGKACVDCCYAFSVFSHLSEDAAVRWMSHLGETLVNGGKLIITTRGLSQVAYIRALHAAAGPLDSFAAVLPSPDEIERRYRDGDFQYYPMGRGAGELTDDFYGESWIAESWMKERYRRLGFSRYEFLTESGVMDQCTFILTK